MSKSQSNDELARLGDQYFQLQHSSDPFNATLLGVPGFDSEVPDPSKEGAEANAARFGALLVELKRLDPKFLGEEEKISQLVLESLVWGSKTDLEGAIWEGNASAAAYVSPQALVFQATPAAVLRDERDVGGYLKRLRSLEGVFDAILERYRSAQRRKRFSSEVGVHQAIEQLEGHLGVSLEDDSLVNVELPAGIERESFVAEAVQVIGERIRPAMTALLGVLREELLPFARDDDHVGIKFIPGGAEAYLDAVRRHTTTDLTPGEMHEIGLGVVGKLKEEWASLGSQALGTSDVSTIIRRLREDKSLRFGSEGEIIQLATDALARAEEARSSWFPHYEIPRCVVEEINPLEAGNAPLAYYRPPSADGTRPGAYCVLAHDPSSRYMYEYEALSFHESTPGHHLQIASAQTLTEIPMFRRFLDAEVCGYVEGWGLYCERLADEMGLYTSDLQRLGMLSFDALRACRLVVDTGMHFYGWSRDKAAEYMWENTATAAANVRNEIDRYIAWPGQALGYMIGKRKIFDLRTSAKERLANGFDIRAFHGAVLGHGALPLNVLEIVVESWVKGCLPL